ncbi:nucleotidyltransferase family protein [Paenibacillus pini]|uniref:Nucleotidyltransferase family protein n=1 Tax=Paenibacillus pini JCM 16418 TaxID=1236976 RepID=W7Z122_9BACL|nr:nucleotidyltransferase family protein [Paenibacillus pini]GAF08064.1 hypothetical protein JCM16418_2102 [Paenibacillus pini JCM 16418]
MNSTISFISALYQGTHPGSLSNEIYVQIYDDLVWFGVEPQIYEMLGRQQLFNAVPEWFASRLRGHIDTVAFQNMLIRSEQNTILRTLDDEGVGVIPLKGIRFAEKYFGKISARATTDIDLLVHKKDLDKAKIALQRLGFKRQIGDDSHFHAEFTKLYERGGIPDLTAEIHWNIVRETGSETDCDRLWEQSILMESYHSIRELSVQHTFYHICLHGINHHMMSLKYFIDIMHLIHYSGDLISYEDMLIQARADQNFSKILIALSLVYHVFPHLHHIKTLPQHKKYPLWSLKKARMAMNGKKGISYAVFRLVSTFAVYDTWKHRGSQYAFMFWGLPILWLRKSKAS